MKFFSAFKELLKRSPLVRFSTLFISIFLLICLTTTIGKQVRRKPVITEISPIIGNPGDKMTIKGNNFGKIKNSSFVEIAGSKITASGYLHWSDNEIEILLPSNVQDGLVLVGTIAGKSQPLFYANDSGIPITIKPDPQTSYPIITAISPQTAKIGEIIVINGMNFGATKENSSIFFTANHEVEEKIDSLKINESEDFYIEANPHDYDYVYWSDTEIHVRVPDGAKSGPVFITTNKGDSASQRIFVNFTAGQKRLHNKRTYVVQLSANLETESNSNNSSISLFIPKPGTSALQPSVVLNECNPKPLISDDPYNIIHQIQFNKSLGKQNFSQTFVVNSYAMESNIIPTKIQKYKDVENTNYKKCISPDQCILSDNQSIKNLVSQIKGKSNPNPYDFALKIYNYLLENYKLEEHTRTGDVSFLDMLKRKKGDSYDFTMMFVTLCRAAGIPCLPISGIIVEKNSFSTVHWWAEIYFENYGWFPVDIALAAGKSFSTFIPVDDPKSFYFGNIDNQHITFSRGWKQIKPSLINGKIVYRPRTYALHSIWEESSNSTLNYSSLWNNPTIIGIY